MIDVNKKIAVFWNNCRETFAHLYSDKNDYLLLADTINNIVSLQDKTIIDFGVGNGAIGDLLFEKFHIQKYIGIDISDRQLSRARETLKHYNAFFCRNINQSFSIYNADVFISLAVIHHFPDLEYLNNFLRNLNNSNIPILVLSIKYLDLNTDYEFMSNPYDSSDINVIKDACKISLNYLCHSLPAYTISDSRIGNKKHKQSSFFFVRK